MTEATGASAASRSLRAAMASAILCLLCASPSLAESEAATAPTTSKTQISLQSDDGAWRYSTYYIYPLTRRMDESDIPNDWRRYALYPVTLTLDTLQLPAGAVIGLFSH